MLKKYLYSLILLIAVCGIGGPSPASAAAGGGHNREALETYKLLIPYSSFSSFLSFNPNLFLNPAAQLSAGDEKITEVWVEGKNDSRITTHNWGREGLVFLFSTNEIEHLGRWGRPITAKVFIRYDHKVGEEERPMRAVYNISFKFVQHTLQAQLLSVQGGANSKPSFETRVKRASFPRLLCHSRCHARMQFFFLAPLP